MFLTIVFNQRGRIIMFKNLSRCVNISLIFITQRAFASGAETGSGLPWEHPIEIIEQSLAYVGYFLCLIGVIWAGYAFMVQGEKEAGFKRLITVIIGSAIIFGAKGILSTLLGARF